LVHNGKIEIIFFFVKIFWDKCSTPILFSQKISSRSEHEIQEPGQLPFGFFDKSLHEICFIQNG